MAKKKAAKKTTKVRSKQMRTGTAKTPLPAAKPIAEGEGASYTVVTNASSRTVTGDKVGQAVSASGLSLVHDWKSGVLVTFVPVGASSNVKAVGWSLDRLHVVFMNDGYYVYPEVKALLFLALTQADSVGKFMNENIKQVYEALKVG